MRQCRAVEEDELELHYQQQQQEEEEEEQEDDKVEVLISERKQGAITDRELA